MPISGVVLFLEVIWGCWRAHEAFKSDTIQCCPRRAHPPCNSVRNCSATRMICPCLDDGSCPHGGVLDPALVSRREVSRRSIVERHEVVCDPSRRYGPGGTLR